MNINEQLKEAQSRRQKLVERAVELRQQAQQLSIQADQCLFDAKEVDGEIKAYTLMRDEETGAKPLTRKKSKEQNKEAK